MAYLQQHWCIHICWQYVARRDGTPREALLKKLSFHERQERLLPCYPPLCMTCEPDHIPNKMS
jgi:hypothetical protein